MQWTMAHWFVYGLIALAILHACLIALPPRTRPWASSVTLYYVLSYISFAILFVLIVGVVISWSGDGTPLFLVSLREFIWLEPYLSGAVVAACAVALVVALIEVHWVHPLRSASRAPSIVWLMWFLITISVAIGINANTRDRMHKPLHQHDIEMVEAGHARLAGILEDNVPLEDLLGMEVEGENPFQPLNRLLDSAIDSLLADEADEGNGSADAGDETDESLSRDELEGMQKAVERLAEHAITVLRLHANVSRADRAVQDYWEDYPDRHIRERWGAIREALGVPGRYGRSSGKAIHDQIRDDVESLRAIALADDDIDLGRVRK